MEDIMLSKSEKEKVLYDLTYMCNLQNERS